MAEVNGSAMMRKGGFGSLTAGMIVRGAVPVQVLYGAGSGGHVLPREPEPTVESEPEISQVVERVVAPPPSPANGAARKAMTVRLDAAQHMRLRVVSAYQRRSAQEVMVQALGRYLDSLPASASGCSCNGA